MSRAVRLMSISDLAMVTALAIDCCQIYGLRSEKRLWHSRLTTIPAIMLDGPIPCATLSSLTIDNERLSLEFGFFNLDQVAPFALPVAKLVAAGRIILLVGNPILSRNCDDRLSIELVF